MHVAQSGRALLVAVLISGLLGSMSPAGAAGLPPAGAEGPLLYFSGAGAGAAAGDWVSAGDGLDAAYNFQIEVPAGAPALIVELFDADVLSGAGRPGEVDMVRGAIGDTKVRYELYDPAGQRVATRFVTADEAGPPAADRSWLTFFSSSTVAAGSGGERFADAFDAPSYAGNDGSRAFSGPWIESGNAPGTGFDGGAIRIEGGRLEISNRGDVEPWLRRPSIERELDLSGFAAANLAFDFAAGPGVDFEDSLLVEVSGDGGASYRVIEELIGLAGGESGRRRYDISDRISARTRIRFRVGRFYAGPGESLALDGLEIRAAAAGDEAPPRPGHWQLVVDMSSRLNREAGADAAAAGAEENGDDVNALGLRAHDGDPGPAGTELPIYSQSFLPLGIHGRPGSRQGYALFPYVTSQCALAVHDFDWDAAPGAAAGSLQLVSRGGARRFGGAAPVVFSADRAWNRNLSAGWPPAGVDYGLWSLAVEIADLGAGNFGTLRLESAASGPGGPPEGPGPSGSPTRVYLPSDSGGAPAKTFLSQSLAFVEGTANPPGPGGRGTYAVTLRLTHPAGAAGDVDFKSGEVTAAIPDGVRYLGPASTAAGTLHAEPARGGGGELRWSPGTLAPGAEATLVYLVEVSGSGLPAPVEVTGRPGAGGTRAELLDETGTAVVLGELCALSVPPDAPLPAADPAASPPPLETSPAAPPAADPAAPPPPLEADPAAPPPGEEAPAPDADYQIGAGDVLRIGVFEDPRLNGDYTVASGGAIVFPLLGEVDVRSLTAGEVQERLTRLLEADYLYNPHVSAMVSAFRSKKVQIQGMVRMPGIYYLEGPTRIFDLLSRAQGLLQAPGEIRAGQVARVVRAGGDVTLNIDLHKLLVLGNDELNVKLEDGDVVYVLRTEEVHVIGEVKRPGSFPYEDGMTVLKALSLAGGATKRGAVKNALVRRIQDGEEVQLKVSMEDLLRPDDILEIPLSFW